MKMMSMIPKALFSAHPIFDKMLNPTHESNQKQSYGDKYGSRSRFTTDCHINGEYFRSRTDNQYFCVVDKNAKVGELSQFVEDFREIRTALRIRNYNPDKHVILRLEFTKNKEYFVENYQAINIKNPDVTVMDMPLDELLEITPKFEKLPNQ